MHDAIGWLGQEHDVFLRIKAEHMIALAQERLGPLSDRRLLDLGCGVGLMHQHLGRAFGSITGTDLDDDAVDAARSSNPSVQYERFDGKRLPFADESFDAVSATNVLHHVPPCDRYALLEEVSRVIRPGGVCLIAEHNPLNPVTRFIVARCEFDDDAVLLWPRETHRLLQLAGFGTDITVRHVVTVPSSAPWAIRARPDTRAGPVWAQYIAAGARGLVGPKPTYSGVRRPPACRLRHPTGSFVIAMTSGNDHTLALHTVAVVVPVYHGETTLEPLIDELSKLAECTWTAGGHAFRVTEVLLVHDCGPDRSDQVIRRLAEDHDFVRPVWLSKNYGQHAATLAGMASTTAEWVVTMDEDGQHDPASIADMLDAAMNARAPLVYANPTNPPPHSFFRNASSAVAHWTASRLSREEALGHFHSYRLVLGELARGLAAYCGESVYLDVALTWVASPVATCPVRLRPERDTRSAYSARRLVSHFWRLVLTSGTRPLRLVAQCGAVLALVAVGLLAWVLMVRFTSDTPPAGWTSVMVLVLVTSGGVLFSLGVVAEYLGIAVKSAMGKPLYLVVSDLASGPLGRAPSRQLLGNGDPAQFEEAPSGPIASPSPAPRAG